MQVNAAGCGGHVSANEYDLSTNLAELPNSVNLRLSFALNFQNVWTKLVDSSSNGPFSLSVSEYDSVLRSTNQGSVILYFWGNHGLSIKSLLAKLQQLSKLHGNSMDGPQLSLRRKFVPVKWTAEEPVTIKVLGTDNCLLQLVCHARGFPWPHFQWLENEKEVEGGTGKAFLITRCKCRSNLIYKCKVWNEIEEGFEYSLFYRNREKPFRSHLITNGINISSFLTDDLKFFSGWNAELIATDKVALIISNCNYMNIPSLVTPHCDAEMFAESLQNLAYKTVTLGDLNLVEMYFFISEYQKLLGDGVYAIFYFVGHGFERNGKNYLLPVDAPISNYSLDDAISVDWILSVLESSHPALNLILLDVCRKNIKCNDLVKSSDDMDTIKKSGIARNTVCVYATSSGINAFEVRGEKNGVFMKHLLRHVADEATVLEMLTRTFQGAEKVSNDAKVGNVQIPELKSNLILPRGLRDPLVCFGHTTSFNFHTLHWRYMHELPNPIYVVFSAEELCVTIWFDYAGHFTNKVYIFSSVSELSYENNTESSRLKRSSTALSYVAHLRFPKHFDVSTERIIEDNEDGISLCVMLSNLQRLKGTISCSVDLVNCENNALLATESNLSLGDVLITRIYKTEH
ncbi:unnamed protein product [Thelazia callipaeda]|uniref:CASPASE_P20 domain-containing protein n=1 Tax=Thelazia callipaeda TaxID=103827 RepID=A0A0N5D4A5_THECL|nr:unnamed protein product [Thelazia callipaeda]